MSRAPLTVGLPTQPHQGVAARFFRRFGGAVRGAIAGISRAGSPRRPAEPPPRLTSATVQDPGPATHARRPPAPRRPRATPPAPPARPGWIARWFGLTPRKPALSRRRTFPDRDDAPFTPETHPGLSPEACAFFNTPVEDCDPELLRLLLTVLAQQLADVLPPELGMTDAQAVFDTLWGRLAGPLGDTGPDAEPAGQPEDAPASPTDAAPVSPPATLPEAPAAAIPDGMAIAAASAITPDIAGLPKPSRRRSQSFRRGCRRPFRRGRTRLPRGLRNGPPSLPPRRLCYAACAGPP